MGSWFFCYITCFAVSCRKRLRSVSVSDVPSGLSDRHSAALGDGRSASCLRDRPRQRLSRTLRQDAALLRCAGNASASRESLRLSRAISFGTPGATLRRSTAVGERCFASGLSSGVSACPSAPKALPDTLRHPPTDSTLRKGRSLRVLSPRPSAPKALPDSPTGRCASPLRRGFPRPPVRACGSPGRSPSGSSRALWALPPPPEIDGLRGTMLRSVSVSGSLRVSVRAKGTLGHAPTPSDRFRALNCRSGVMFAAALFRATSPLAIYPPLAVARGSPYAAQGTVAPRPVFETVRAKAALPDSPTGRCASPLRRGFPRPPVRACGSPGRSPSGRQGDPPEIDGRRGTVLRFGSVSVSTPASPAVLPRRHSPPLTASLSRLAARLR